jgi:hypothetical protein
MVFDAEYGNNGLDITRRILMVNDDGTSDGSYIGTKDLVFAGSGINKDDLQNEDMVCLHPSVNGLSNERHVEFENDEAHLLSESQRHNAVVNYSRQTGRSLEVFWNSDRNKAFGLLPPSSKDSKKPKKKCPKHAYDCDPLVDHGLCDDDHEFVEYVGVMGGRKIVLSCSKKGKMGKVPNASQKAEIIAYARMTNDEKNVRRQELGLEPININELRIRHEEKNAEKQLAAQ